MSALPIDSFTILRTPGAVSILAIALLIGRTVAAQGVNQAGEDANRGLSLAREGKLPEAEQELRNAVKAAPGVALRHAQLGSILGLQGKWEEALASFQKAVDLDPTDINLRREIAAVQWQLRRMSAAEKNLRYVLARRPEDPGAILLLGLVREADGDYVAASRLLHSQFNLVISQPDRTVAMFQADVKSGQRNNIPKIIESLKGRANDPAWADAIGRCTQIAATNGDLESAETLFVLVPENQPSRLAAGFELARLRFNRGQMEAAQQLLLQLSAASKENPNVQALLGHCYETLHHPDLALEAYQRALDLAPSQVERYEDLIMLELQMGRSGDAMSLANRLVSVAPRDARSWVLKANVEMRASAVQDALKSYTLASHLDPKNADAALGLAGIHALSGLNDGVTAEYKTGIQRFPDDSRFYVAFAAALLASPEAPQAYPQTKGLLLQAIKLDSHSPDAHYQLGQLALRQGQVNDAKEEFSASLQADPNRSNTHFGLSLVYRRLGLADDSAREFKIYQRLKEAEDPETSLPGRVPVRP